MSAGGTPQSRPAAATGKTPPLMPQHLTLPPALSEPMQPHLHQAPPQMAAPPRPMMLEPPPPGRALLPVAFLSSISVGTAGTVAHLYALTETVGNDSFQSGSNEAPKRRIVVVTDTPTYEDELNSAVNRCVRFSECVELAIPLADVRPLTGPLNEFDVLLRHSTAIDFLRIISAVFKPHHASVPVPTFAPETTAAPNGARLFVKLAPGSLQDTTDASTREVMLRRHRDDAAKGLKAMEEAFEKERDVAVQEAVSLSAEIQSLKQALHKAEQEIVTTRRDARLERDRLVTEVRQLQLERDVAKAASASPHRRSATRPSGMQQSAVSPMKFDRIGETVVTSDGYGGYSPTQRGGSSFGQRPATKPRDLSAPPAAIAPNPAVAHPAASSPHPHPSGYSPVPLMGGQGLPPSPYAAPAASVGVGGRVDRTFERLEAQLREGESLLNAVHQSSAPRQ